MSLNSLHIELLKTINKTPGCKSYEQLISENGDKMIYNTYLYRKRQIKPRLYNFDLIC